MKPELVIEFRSDRDGLIKAMLHFANQMITADDRQSILTNADVLLDNIKYDANAFNFANNLVARLTNRAISDEGAMSHPMTKILSFMLDTGPENYGLDSEDVTLCKKLLVQISDRAFALAARAAVGKIEDANNLGIGTGVLICRNQLLTCNHIFSKTGVESAQVRFGYYKNGSDWVKNGITFELDMKQFTSRGGGPNPDFALIRVEGDLEVKWINLNITELNSGEDVRMIHHPGGKPAIVSDKGQISRVGRDYVLHNISTEDGSSGAPIFNKNWELVAIHRGKTNRVTEGITEAVPLHALWNFLQPHL